jgi:hypothetical protein
MGPVGTKDTSENKIMRKLLIVTTALFLVGATGAVAEDNANMIQPVAHGAVTGDAEKDTVAYDVAPPSDLWVRFSDECIVQGDVRAQANAAPWPAEWNPNPR